MEIWKDIKGFEGIYQISNLGNVKSLRNNKILKTKLVGIGYKGLILCKNKIHYTKKIHRLIAETFIPNPNHYPCVNHIDGNKLNNNINNLEWCTSSYNNKEAYRLGLKRSLKGKNNGYSRSLMTPINQYNLEGKFIKKWGSQKEIQNTLGIAYQNVAKCCKGERNKAGGYKWKFANGIMN